MHYPAAKPWRPRGEGKLYEVFFELPKADWHSYSTEKLWAERLRRDRYRLCNIPFVLYGYSLGDIVRVEPSLGRRLVRGLILRGGHSTYRLFLTHRKYPPESDFFTLGRRLSELGCRYEPATEHLMAVDVPPRTTISSVVALLEQGQLAGLWDFEEADRSPVHL